MESQQVIVYLFWYFEVIVKPECFQTAYLFIEMSRFHQQLQLSQINVTNYVYFIISSCINKDNLFLYWKT